MKVSVDKGVAAGVEVELLLPEGQSGLMLLIHSSDLSPLCASEP
jgi:hypothetical protein